MTRLWALLVLSAALAGAAAGQDVEGLRQPTNSALGIPLGEGLELLNNAEPLGKGRFRVRVLNRSHSVSIPELGEGSSYTGHYGLGFGVTPQIDASLMVPFLIDSVGGLNKYGTGDVVFGIKWGKPAKIPAGHYTGVQLLMGLPLGFKGKRGLDQFAGGVRPFSNEALDIGVQFLSDINFRPLSVYLNGGFFRSGNPEVLSQLVYGVGLETGRRHPRLSLNVEYQARVAFTEESRASGVLKVGGRFHMGRGIELELNREWGFLDHPVPGIFTFGLRLHGQMGAKRRLLARQTLYRPPPRPPRPYEPEQVLRIAIVDFAGYEEYGAGHRLVEKLRLQLAPHDSIQVVDLSRYTGIKTRGELKPEEALRLARRLRLDVVLSGRVARYEVERLTGTKVPYVFEVPEAAARVGLRYRVLSFADAARTRVESHTQEAAGEGRVRRRPRLLPLDRRDITAVQPAGELVRIQDEALDDLVGNMLATLAERYSWVPPSFMP